MTEVAYKEQIQQFLTQHRDPEIKF